jgi:hypothetical protein
MTAEEAAKMKPILDETYGKVVYFGNWEIQHQWVNHLQ